MSFQAIWTGSIIYAYYVFVIVISRFLERPQKRSRGNQLIHRRLTKTKSSQSALELGPSHFPNGRLRQDLDFGGFAFALKLPELLNTNLPTVRVKLGQTSSFPNRPHIWFPIGQ